MFLASNMLPLSLVESRSFKEMCKRFCGNYEVPSRYIITEQIKLYYEDVVIHLKDELSKCCYASMTTDAWSSINQISFYHDYSCVYQGWRFSLACITNSIILC